MSENPADYDGAITRSAGWVRFEDWFRNDDARTTSPPPNLSTTEGES